jgi:O-antigen/teichoic acid export membrane protein
MKLIDRILSKTRLSANRRKVVANVFWAVSGKVVKIISGLLVGIMVARYLGPDQFGLMNYVISYVTLFTVFSTFGLDGIEIRELSKNNEDKDTILGTAFTLRLIFALATILLVLATLRRFESDKYTFAMVMAYSLSLIFMTLNVIRNYFTSIILNEYVVKTEISRTIIGSVIKVVLLLNHCSLTWFIVASTFDFLLIGGGYLYSYRKKVGSILSWRFDASVAKLLTRASFPLLLSGTAVVVYQKINAIMIRNMMDNAAVGQFSVAAKITELGVFIPLVIAQSVTPLLVKAHQEDAKRYREKCQQFMDIMVWSSIIMALFLSLLANPVIRFLYGEQYAAAIPVLQIMAWRTVFMALSSSSAQMIIIENLQRYAVMRNLVGLVVSVGLNFLLIPKWGVVGSAFAMVATMAFAGYFSHFAIRPYHYLVPMQTKAIFLGWRQGVDFFARRIKATP